jgi:hypothetical protein
MCAHDGQEPILELGPFPAHLREPRRDDADGASPLLQRGLRRSENELRRNADDRELDLGRDLVDGPVAVHARHCIAGPVDGVGGALVAADDDVAKELAADTPRARGGTEDGDAGRLEERAKRCDDRGVVSFIHARSVLLGGRDRELELEGPRVEPANDVESGIGKDTKHGGVLRQHRRDESLHAPAAGDGGELLEQARPDPTALQLICDRKRDLGLGRISQPVVGGHGHDPRAVRVCERSHQRAPLGPVRLENVLDELRPERRHPMEAQMQALGRKPFEEPQQLGCIFPSGRAKPERAPVPQNHVEEVGVLGHSSASCPESARGWRPGASPTSYASCGNPAAGFREGPDGIAGGFREAGREEVTR